jgi:hypothetical protein
MESFLFEKMLNDARYPKEAVESLVKDYRALLNSPACRAILEGAYENYKEGRCFSFYGESERLVTAAKEETDVHPYGAEILFYLHLAPLLKDHYERDAIPSRYFDGFMEGVLCKLFECHKLFGIWGSFVAVWFSRFFARSLYAIGRFECCLMPCPLDFEKEGKRISKGAPVIDVHIPSRGRLEKEEMERSYLEAAEFFSAQIKGDPAFHCESWLLADFHREMLPKNAGIRLFADRYQLVERTPDEGDFWRIFYLPDDTDPSSLPENTALQKGYKNRLLKGLDLYGGRGYFFL